MADAACDGCSRSYTPHAMPEGPAFPCRQPFHKHTMTQASGRTTEYAETENTDQKGLLSQSG